jgi:hypothetical protein
MVAPENDGQRTSGEDFPDSELGTASLRGWVSGIANDVATVHNFDRLTIKQRSAYVEIPAIETP